MICRILGVSPFNVASLTNTTNGDARTNHKTPPLSVGIE
jgi:hypothetical protein